MSIANRIIDLEAAVTRLYAERHALNSQVMDITRNISALEDQISDLEAKRDGVM